MFSVNDDEKIVLDNITFKALAVDTRVDILKSLLKRQKTQTELANELNLSVVTIKEHLDKLSDANLVKKIDNGRKWKYYHLTEKARCVLFPERKKIWVLLVSILFVAFLSVLLSFDYINLNNFSVMQDTGLGNIISPEVYSIETGSRNMLPQAEEKGYYTDSSDSNINIQNEDADSDYDNQNHDEMVYASKMIAGSYEDDNNQNYELEHDLSYDLENSEKIVKNSISKESSENNFFILDILKYSSYVILLLLSIFFIYLGVKHKSNLNNFE
jgi:predicted transcriptional regulator